MKKWFRKRHLHHEASAIVQNGVLILTLPDAVFPTVSRIPVEDMKSSVIEVRSGRNGCYVLASVRPDGVVHEIADYTDRSLAISAMLKASNAMQDAALSENGQAGNINASQDEVHLPNGLHSGHTNNTKRGASGFLIAALLVTGAIALLVWGANQEPGSPDDIASVTKASSGRGSFNEDVVAPAGRDHVYGREDAPITLIEYSDLECPYCKRFHPIAKKLVDQSNGRINWAYRHVPLHGDNAMKQALAAECVAHMGNEQAFWRYINTIFARTESGGDGFPLDELTPMAGQLGLDEQAFKKCWRNGKYRKRVEKHIQQARSLDIRGTPGIVLYNNKTGRSKIFSGLHERDFLKKQIQGMR